MVSKRPKIVCQDGRATVYIYDEIGESFWGEGVTAKQFVQEVNALDVGQIDVRINSPGGNVFDAVAMHAALTQHPARIVTHNDGLAASAAAVMFMAGDERLAAPNSMLMIHEAWSMTVGNKRDHSRTMDLLGQIDGNLINIFAGPSGQDDSKISKWLAAETWFTATEAQEAGFATTADAAAPAVAAHRVQPKRYKYTPTDLISEPTRVAGTLTTPEPAGWKDYGERLRQIAAHRDRLLRR